MSRFTAGGFKTRPYKLYKEVCYAMAGDARIIGRLFRQFRRHTANLAAVPLQDRLRDKPALPLDVAGQHNLLAALRHLPGTFLTHYAS